MGSEDQDRLLEWLATIPEPGAPETIWNRMQRKINVVNTINSKIDRLKRRFEETQSPTVAALIRVAERELSVMLRQIDRLQAQLQFVPEGNLTGACQNCQMPFNLLERPKRQCRFCERFLCYNCCRYRAYILQALEPQIVCQMCFIFLSANPFF